MVGRCLIPRVESSVTCVGPIMTSRPSAGRNRYANDAHSVQMLYSVNTFHLCSSNPFLPPPNSGGHKPRGSYRTGEWGMFSSLPILIHYYMRFCMGVILGL
jgi:hypothetical protein